jgi:acyl-CoA synthetase (AMP-forming)/AMP-acid ligase II
LSRYRLAEQPDLRPLGRHDRVALRQGGSQVTFGELDERAGRYASGLAAAGVSAGDRVLVVLPNSVRLFEMLIGAARVGAVTVPVNTRLSDRELRDVADDAGAAVVVGESSLLERVPVVDDERLRLGVGPEYEAWLAGHDPSPARPGSPEDVVLQIYTSGTSGRPKGVLLTDGNLAAKVTGVVNRWALDGSSTSLLATPLFHVGALSWGLVGLAAGATTVLADDARPLTIARHLAEDRVSHAFLVPSMLGALAREVGPGGSAFPALRTVVYGGSPISDAERRAAATVLGSVLRQVYGMTETTGGFTELEPDPARPDGDPRSESAGRAYPWVELEIHDPVTDALLPPGEVGEVWTRSAQNCAGYHGMPLATEELLHDGWLRTGDLGRLDSDGYLYVTGRLRDMIITGGENVYPSEVEQVLRLDPAVADVVVIGEPDPTWGETVVAVVVLNPSAQRTPESILEATRGELAGYKRPRRVHIVDELPRNASGKVATGALRARLAAASVRRSVMSIEPVRILAFVNHIAPVPGIEADIARAFEWGVDVVVAQGTGSDWGPYWLGSGQQVSANQAANVEPYVRAAIEHGVPFVFSFGIAGGNVHLDACLGAFDVLCARNGWSLEVGVIRSEVDPDLLLATIAGDQLVVPAGPGVALSPRLTTQDVHDAERIVALIGPEPVMAALDRGVDGVITGRALDIGLFMALPMLRGIPTAVAALAGKLLECGGLALEPGDSGRCLWASLDETGVEVRSPSPDARATVRSLVSHTFYERSHPTQEENPGGLLDLGDATYVETSTGIRCEGARWVEQPYTVLVEGARREGFRAVSLLGVREPALLAQARSWADAAEAAVAAAPRFANAVHDGRLRIATRIFGLDAVLGPLEPNTRVTGHEAGVLVDVVADTEEMAREAAYFAFIRLFIGPYPGRKTTAGNAAAPIMPVVVPVSEVYSFSIYHLLPLDDPVAPFPTTVVRFPRAATEFVSEEAHHALV